MTSRETLNNLIGKVGCSLLLAIANGKEVTPDVLTPAQREVIELFRHGGVGAAFVTVVFNLPEGRITRTILVNPSATALQQWGRFQQNHRRAVEADGSHHSVSPHGWVLEDPMPGLEVDLDYAEVMGETDPCGRPWPALEAPFDHLLATTPFVVTTELDEGSEESIDKENDGGEGVKEEEEEEEEKTINIGDTADEEMEVDPAFCDVCQQTHVPDLPAGDDTYQGHPRPSFEGEEDAEAKMVTWESTIRTRKHRAGKRNLRKIDSQVDAAEREKTRVNSKNYRDQLKAEKEAKDAELKRENAELRRRLGLPATEQTGSAKGGVKKRKK